MCIPTMALTLLLEEFDASADLRADAGNVCLVIGRRATGKTFLAHQLLKALVPESAIADVHVFSGGSVEGKDAYRALMPTAVVYPTTDVAGEYHADPYLDDLHRALLHENNDRSSATVVVMDDIYADAHAWSSPSSSFHSIIRDARATRASVIVTMQYPCFLAPPMREQIDFVFMLCAASDHHHSATAMHRLYDLYFHQVFPRRAAFRAALAQMGSSRDCLVLDVRRGKLSVLRADQT